MSKQGSVTAATHRTVRRENVRLKAQIKELEARIELALRMPAFFTGYVNEALKGRKLEDMPAEVQACLKP